MTSDVRTQLQTTLGAAYTLERELGGGFAAAMRRFNLDLSLVTAPDRGRSR